MQNIIKKIYDQKKEILKKSLDYCKNQIGFIPEFGFELEFYLFQKSGNVLDKQITDFINQFNSYLRSNLPLIRLAKKEQGLSQIEIETDFTGDIIPLTKELDLAKCQISKIADSLDLIADFSALPSISDCGSALQINISCDRNSEQIIQDLLSNSNQIMILLSPNLQDYQRFNPDINCSLFRSGKYTAPVNLSYGVDNRSCAIRLIKNRIEYRVPAASADIFVASLAVLLAMSVKASSDKKFHRIYGNAFNDHYELEGICQSQQEAEKLFLLESNSIKEKIVEFL